MANWEAFSVADVIREIDDDKYVLPVIQRRFVWNEEKIELLFDTLLKGDSFGGIMVIREEKGEKPLFSFRTFSKDGNNIGSRNVEILEQNQRFVIDGQQRLQAFYIGLAGTLSGRKLFFDLFSDYMSCYEFLFEQDTGKLPKEVSNESTRIINKCLWIEAESLLRDLKATGRARTTSNNLFKRFSIVDQIEKECIEYNVDSFCSNVMSNKTIGISEVVLDRTSNETANRQRIVELFRRLNDGGTKLSSFDLVASILKGFEWTMEAFLDDALAEFKDIGLSQENLVKLIFILQDNPSKEMTDITSSDAQFAINCKKRIWSALVSLRKFLKHSELYDYYREGGRSFVPLFFIVYHVFHKKITDNDVESCFDDYDTGNLDYKPIKLWMYLSLLNGVFRSRGAGWTPYTTGVRKFLEVFKKNKNLVFPIRDLLRVYVDYGVSFVPYDDVNNIEKFELNFLFYLLYDCKQISRNQDADHIMPKSILEKMNYNPDIVNSVKNKQLLDSGTNRDIKRAKPFKSWVTDTNCVANLNSYIQRHLIPDDSTLWDEDKFLEFVDARGTLIANKIQHFFKTI